MNKTTISIDQKTKKAFVLVKIRRGFKTADSLLKDMIKFYRKKL